MLQNFVNLTKISIYLERNLHITIPQRCISPISLEIVKINYIINDKLILNRNLSPEYDHAEKYREILFEKH